MAGILEGTDELIVAKAMLWKVDSPNDAYIYNLRKSNLLRPPRTREVEWGRIG